MKLKPWMYVAAGLAALWFLNRKKAPGLEPMIQSQNLFIDP
jgi:hypothetical protein